MARRIHVSDDGPVLVTGAAGFLLAESLELLRRRISAVALVRQRGNAWRISGLADLVVVEAEMTKPSTIAPAIDTTTAFDHHKCCELPG